MVAEHTAKEARKVATTPRESFVELRDWRPSRTSPPTFLERWFRELDEDWPWTSARPGWLPAIDVHEADDAYAVTVELPGSRRQDVAVEIGEGVITVRGEKRSERDETKEQRRFAERRYGAFSRSFSLPRDVDAEHIAATFDNGVLTIRLPRRQSVGARTAAIH